MGKLLSRLVSRGWRHGVLKGERLWLGLGGAAWVLRHLRKGEPEVVHSEVLEPGESLRIEHLVETFSDQRRRARRSSG